MSEPASPAVSIVESLEELPPFPPILSQVLVLIEDGESSAEDLAHLIEKDQGLASRLLKLTNSAFFGFPRRIGNITTAVVLLGFNNVKNLVLGISFLDFYQQKKSPVIDAADLWRHSYAAALSARTIAVKTRLEDFETTFAIALLHDVGKLVIAWALRDRIPQDFKLLEAQGIRGLMDERRLFGTDHAELGAELAASWHFPRVFSDVIRLHEAPFLNSLPDPNDTPQLLAVHLADIIAWPRTFGDSLELPAIPFLQTVVERLRLSPAELTRIAADSSARSAQVLQALGG